MKTERLSGVLALFLIVIASLPWAGAGASASAADLASTGVSDPAVLAAANRLLAEPWRAVARQYKEDAEDTFRQLEDKDLSNSGTKKAGRLRWSLRQWLTNARAEFDVAAPPGLRALSTDLDGFTFEVPLNGSWSFLLRGTLHTKVKVWDKDFPDNPLFTFSPSLGFGLFVRDFKVAMQAVLDNRDRERPVLDRATINAHLRLGGEGVIPISIPISLTVTIDPDDDSLKLRGPIDLTLIGLGDLRARLRGEFVVTFSASRGTESETSPLDRMTLALKGSLSAELRHVGGVSVPFSFETPLCRPVGVQGTRLQCVALPVPDFFQTLRQGVPRTWGVDAGGQPLPGGVTPPPPANVDYGTPAAQYENAILAHMPADAVLSIDFPQRARATYTYGKEADSAIFTGHYLAAESFRFAATGSPAALDRVKRVLGGVKRLFDVTQDAAVRFEDGHRTRAAVQYAGIFARTALSPSTDGHGFSEGPLSSRPCYYEAPEGGWDVVAGGRTFHYAKFSAIPPFQLRSATSITPVGTVWYGWGCGSRHGDQADHAISRDAYTGVMMGLAYAYLLVPDQGVRGTAKKLIEQTLDHLLENHWTVVLPPENRAATFFIGNFDQQLAFLLIGRLVNPGKYGPRYDRDVAAAGAAWLPTWFSVLDPVPKYYKFNLAHAGGLLPLFLETDETRRAGYLTAYRMLRKATRHHRSAYFNLSRILIELPARRASVALEPSGSNPQLTLKDEIRSILADFLERRRLLLPAGGTGIPRNFVADPKYQVRRWPNDVAVYRPLEGGGKGYQVKFAMPPTGRIGAGTDYMWEVSPFGYALKFGDPRCSVRPLQRLTERMIQTCGSDLNREGPGVDYLLAYWLSVYLGVLPRP